jgi:hypothetical protein
MLRLDQNVEIDSHDPARRSLGHRQTANAKALARITQNV